MATTIDAAPSPTPGTSLYAVSCGDCGLVSVPVQNFGCERCGAHCDTLTTIELGGEGELLSAVVVEQAPTPRVPAPYIVGVLQLSEGPVVRALLGMQQPPQRGSRMVGGVESIDGTDVVVFREMSDQ